MSSLLLFSFKKGVIQLENRKEPRYLLPYLKDIKREK